MLEKKYMYIFLKVNVIGCLVCIKVERKLGAATFKFFFRLGKFEKVDNYVQEYTYSKTKIMNNELMNITFVKKTAEKM